MYNEDLGSWWTNLQYPGLHIFSEIKTLEIFLVILFSPNLTILHIDIGINLENYAY